MKKIFTDYRVEVQAAYNHVGLDVRSKRITSVKPGMKKLIKLTQIFLKQSEVPTPTNKDEDTALFDSLCEEAPMIYYYYGNNPKMFPTASLLHLTDIMNDIVKLYRNDKKSEEEDLNTKLSELEEDETIEEEKEDITKAANWTDDDPDFIYALHKGDKLPEKRSKEEKSYYINHILKNYNNSKKALAETYGIPLRTLNDWVNKGTAPDYVLNMLLMLEPLPDEETEDTED